MPPPPPSSTCRSSRQHQQEEVVIDRSIQRRGRRAEGVTTAWAVPPAGRGLPCSLVWRLLSAVVGPAPQLSPALPCARWASLPRPRGGISGQGEHPPCVAGPLCRHSSPQPGLTGLLCSLPGGACLPAPGRGLISASLPHCRAGRGLPRPAVWEGLSPCWRGLPAPTLSAKMGGADYSAPHARGSPRPCAGGFGLTLFRLPASVGGPPPPRAGAARPVPRGAGPVRLPRRAPRPAHAAADRARRAARKTGFALPGRRSPGEGAGHQSRRWPGVPEPRGCCGRFPRSSAPGCQLVLMSAALDDRPGLSSPFTPAANTPRIDDDRRAMGERPAGGVRYSRRPGMSAKLSLMYRAVGRGFARGARGRGLRGPAGKTGAVVRPARPAGVWSCSGCQPRQAGDSRQRRGRLGEESSLCPGSRAPRPGGSAGASASPICYAGPCPPAGAQGSPPGGWGWAGLVGKGVRRRGRGSRPPLPARSGGCLQAAAGCSSSGHRPWARACGLCRGRLPAFSVGSGGRQRWRRCRSVDDARCCLPPRPESLPRPAERLCRVYDTKQYRARVGQRSCFISMRVSVVWRA